MSIKTDSLYIDNFPALHAGLVGKDNWQIPVSGQWVPSITGEGATGTWNIDISGTATEISIAASGDSIYGAESKFYLPLCPSGDNSTMLYSSQYFCISGTSQELPHIRGVCASPWLMQEKDLYDSSANYILLGRAPNKGDARFDGHGSTTEYPAYYSNDLSLVKLQNGAIKYTALQVPDLIIGSAATPAHLLSQKTITIAGNTLSLFGNNNTISRQDLLQSLGLSYALRFVGMTNDANLKEGYDQAPNDRPGYVPSFGDVILGSGPIGGREFVWTPNSGLYPYDGPGSWTLLGVETSSYKVKQDIVTNPTLDESAFVSYCIDSITQNQQGVITATKRPIYANYAHMVDQVLKNDSAQYHPLLFGNLTTDTEENTILSSHLYGSSNIFIKPDEGGVYANKLIAQQENINASIDIRTSNGLTFPAFSLNNLHTLYLKPDINTNGYDSRLRLFKNIGGTALGYTLLVPTLEPNDNKNTSAQIELPNITQRLIGTAGSNILEGNFSPKISNTYNLGAPSQQWQNIYATTFNGNLVGIADEAKKVSNSLTINNRGKEITFNGEKSATLIVNRRCSVGRSGAFQTNENAFYTESNQLKSWQKIASIAFQPGYTDREIVFKVSKGLNAHQHSGILRAHLRVNASTALADKVNKQLIWEYVNGDIDTNNFMLTVAADTTNNKIIGEIWINIGDTSYDIYHFDVMQEHDRSIGGKVGYSELWTLYNRDGSKEEDWQYFDLNEMSNKTLSVLATIKNNASTATSLSGVRDANTVLAAPNGSNGTATFRKLVAADLPIASATEAGIITAGTQSLAGNKTFTGATAFKSAPTIFCQNNTQHNHILKFADINGELIGGIVNDIGTDTNNIAYNKIGFRSYSATYPNGTSTTDKYEVYYLPETTDNISSNVGYNILTTKTHSWDILDNRYINAAGDSDITGNLVMTKDGGMIKLSSKTAYDNGTTYSVALRMDSDRVNRGLFDATNNQWMLYKGAGEDVIKTPSLFQAPRIILTNTTDAKLEKYDTVALTIGSSAAQHLEFDNNEIVSKTNASTAGILGLNMEGSVQLGKMILQSSNYGTLAPTDSNNTNTSSPVNGQIYFQLIE